MAGVTLIGLLNQVTDQFSSKRALSVSGKFDLTYSRIHELVERAASRLVAAGINPGDVVALTFPNTVEVRLFFYFIHIRNFIVFVQFDYSKFFKPSNACYVSVLSIKNINK